MATEKSREMAAQVWCRPEASHIVMDCELAEAFANSLDELKARIAKAIDRGIATLPPNADASDFIRIQAAAGIEPLYGKAEAVESERGYVPGVYDRRKVDLYSKGSPKDRRQPNDEGTDRCQHCGGALCGR